MSGGGGVRCCFPYGALIATLLYCVFCYLILTLLADGFVCEDDVNYEDDTNSTTTELSNSTIAPTDEEDPCRSEGVDNSYITWTSDIYLAIWSLLLAIHIMFVSKTKALKKGHSLSLVLMGLGYLVRAAAQRYFYNSGEGDGKGMRQFYFTWPISYFFLTLSIYKFSSYTRQSWQAFLKYQNRKPQSQRRTKTLCCCGLFEVILFESLTLFTFTVILIACVICILDDEVVVEEAIDQYEYDDDSSEPIAVQIIMYANMAWFTWQALFWVSASSMLGTLAMEDPIDVWGLPNSLAAASIMILQLGAGGLWIILSILRIEVDEELREMYISASSMFFHYGMIMTALFAHNLMITVDYDPSYPSKLTRRRHHEYDDSSDEETGGIVRRMPDAAGRRNPPDTSSRNSAKESIRTLSSRILSRNGSSNTLFFANNTDSLTRQTLTVADASQRNSTRAALSSPSRASARRIPSAVLETRLAEAKSSTSRASVKGIPVAALFRTSLEGFSEKMEDPPTTEDDTSSERQIVAKDSPEEITNHPRRPSLSSSTLSEQIEVALHLQTVANLENNVMRDESSLDTIHRSNAVKPAGLYDASVELESESNNKSTPITVQPPGDQHLHKPPNRTSKGESPSDLPSADAPSKQEDNHFDCTCIGDAPSMDLFPKQEEDVPYDEGSYTSPVEQLLGWGNSLFGLSAEHDNTNRPTSSPGENYAEQQQQQQQPSNDASKDKFSTSAVTPAGTPFAIDSSKNENDKPYGCNSHDEHQHERSRRDIPTSDFPFADTDSASISSKHEQMPNAELEENCASPIEQLVGWGNSLFGIAGDSDGHCAPSPSPPIPNSPDDSGNDGTSDKNNSIFLPYLHDFVMQVYQQREQHQDKDRSSESTSDEQVDEPAAKRGSKEILGGGSNQEETNAFILTSQELSNKLGLNNALVRQLEEPDDNRDENPADDKQDDEARLITEV